MHEQIFYKAEIKAIDDVMDVLRGKWKIPPIHQCAITAREGLQTFSVTLKAFQTNTPVWSTRTVVISLIDHQLDKNRRSRGSFLH